MIGSNIIKGSCASALAEMIANNTTLIFFDLSENKLGVDGGIAIGDSLQNNNSIKELILSTFSLILLRK